MTTEEKQKVQRLLNLHSAVCVFYEADNCFNSAEEIQHQQNCAKERDDLAFELGLVDLFICTLWDFPEHQPADD